MEGERSRLTRTGNLELGSPFDGMFVLGEEEEAAEFPDASGDERVVGEAAVVEGGASVVGATSSPQ